MRSNKDHRVLALRDFQEKDFEDVMKRPIYCSKQRHEKEELKYFCKNCTEAACQSCVLIDHAGHAIAHLDEEAEKQKIQMKSLIETKKSDLREKINIVGQLDQDYAKIIQRGEDLKREVQELVDNCLQLLKQKNKPFMKQWREKRGNRSKLLQGKKRRSNVKLW